VYGHPEHCHLECISCGKIIEDKLTAMQKDMMQQLCVKHHFQATELEIHLQGYCENCRSLHQDRVKT
jgi:Fe2+ or Zn2+ uptake regulation protein